MELRRFNNDVFFAVSEAYASGAYQVNPTRILQAKNAVANAEAILSEYAGATNYQKLKGYKERICGLVAYNEEAVSNQSAADSNAWELVWVFDGDDSTKVVCEGYSKAFQYLCDRSDFDGDVNCASVTGYMNGGAHMWNIVRMPDGNNYLVDVTNCDDYEDGRIGVGWPDELFMAGYYSGSVGAGYTFRCTYPWGDSNDVLYEYDEDLLDIYSTDALTISNADYLQANVWSDPVYTWAEDYSTLTATRVRNDGTGDPETETVGRYRSIISPTQDAGGQLIYTSYPFENDAFEAQTAVVPIPALSEMRVLYLPADLTVVDNEAFTGIDVDAVIIPGNCRSIGRRAFADCPNLMYVLMPQTVTLASNAFEGCGSIIFDIIYVK